MKSITDLKKYLYENPIKSVVIMINMLGGLLYLFYFIHIDFMPTLHIQDMIHLVFAMAFMGLLIVIFLIMLLIAPALMWKYILEKALSNIIEASIKKEEKRNFNKKEHIIRNGARLV